MTRGPVNKLKGNQELSALSCRRLGASRRLAHLLPARVYADAYQGGLRGKV